MDWPEEYGFIIIVLLFAILVFLAAIFITLRSPKITVTEFFTKEDIEKWKKTTTKH